MALGFTASADSSSAFDSGVTPVGRRMHASRIAEGERRALEKFVVGEVNAPGPFTWMTPSHHVMLVQLVKGNPDVVSSSPPALLCPPLPLRSQHLYV